MLWVVGAHCVQNVGDGRLHWCVVVFIVANRVPPDLGKRQSLVADQVAERLADAPVRVVVLLPELLARMAATV